MILFNDILPSGDFIVKTIGLDNLHLIEKEPFFRRDQYYSIINWLQIYPSPKKTLSTYQERVEGILEAYYLLINLGELRKAQKILQLPTKNFGVDFFEQLDVWGYNRKRLEMATAFYREDLPIDLKAFGLKLLGMAHHHLDNFDLAEVYFRRSIEVYKALNDKLSVLFLMHTLGILMLDKAEDEEAKTCFQMAIESAEMLNLRIGLASFYNDLARAHSYTGHLEKAKLLYKKSLELHQKQSKGSEGSITEAWIIHNYSKVLYDIGELRVALFYSQRSYQMFFNHHFKNGLAWSSYVLALIWFKLGKLERCNDAIERCKKLFLELESSHGIRHILMVEGELALAKRDLKMAAIIFSKILKFSLIEKRAYELCTAFSGLAQLSNLVNKYETSTILLGVSDSFRTDSKRGGKPIVLLQQKSLYLQNKTVLGNSLFQRLWRKGKRMKIEQAVVLTLSIEPMPDAAF